MSEGEKAPSLNDYLAGAMLANGVVWIWVQALPLLSGVPPALLGNISYILFLAGSIVTSYLVCKRASSKHLLVGLKLAALTWIFSFILMLSVVPEPTIGLTVALLVIFAAGGVAGAYLALRSRLRALRAPSETPEDV